jgi:hypothetical protein
LNIADLGRLVALRSSAALVDISEAGEVIVYMVFDSGVERIWI